MTITVDTGNITVDTEVANASSPQSFSHTCGSNVKLLIVAVTIYDTSATDGVVSAVTYNFTNFLTYATRYYDATCDGHVSIWYMFDPPTGSSYTTGVEFGGTVTDYKAAAIGVNGTVGTYELDSTGTPATGNGNPTITWSTSAADTIVFGAMLDDQSVGSNVTSDNTEVYTTDVGSDTVGVSYAIRTSSGSQTVSWTDTDADEDFVVVGAAFKEASTGTNTSDLQDAYLKGSQNTSDSQITYLQGSIDTSDAQPAYLAGNISSSDSQPTYTAGADTANDSQLAYLSGSTDTSNSQPTYLVGSTDDSDSQNAYLVGGDTDSDSQPAYTEGVAGGTNPSVSWLWIMVPSGTMTDSQAAYLAGGVQLSDNQPSYTSGKDTASDSQPAYLAGRDTASSQQNAYSSGLAGSSTSQVAFTAGNATENSSVNAFTAGENTASDNQSAFTVGGLADSQPAYLEGAGAISSLDAYTAGTSTDSDSQPAYTYGIVLSSQPAFTEGWAPSASSSQDAYTEGFELTASDSQPAYMDATLHGTIDVQINADIEDCYQWYSYAGGYWTRYIDRTYVQTNGQINSPYLAGWRFLGIDIPDQSTYSVTITKAYMTLYVYTPSYDDPHVRFYAQDNIAPTAPETGPMLDGRPMTDAYATWEEHGVYNKLGGYPNIWIPTPDISAPIQEVIDRPGWTPGFNICIMGYQLEDNADFRTADYAYLDNTYGAKLHIEFVVGENNTQPAYLAGSNSGSSSQSAYMDCAEVDSQPAYTAGTDTDADSQTAWAAGGIVSSDNTPAYTQGTGNISWQDVYTHGKDTTSDAQSSYTVGGVADSQPAMVMADTLGPAQSAYTEGYSGIHSDSQSGYTSGTDTDSDSQIAYMSGVILSTSSQSAFCNSGQLSTTSKQSAYISSDIKSTQSAYLEGESTVYPYIIVSTEDRSTSLKFAVLAEGYADTMFETGRLVHKTIPGGFDITSGELRRKWSPSIKVNYTESRADYGTVADLESLYTNPNPVLWQDHYGQEYKVRIVGDFQKSVVGIVVEGAGSAFIVRIDILEELNP